MKKIKNKKHSRLFSLISTIILIALIISARHINNTFKIKRVLNDIHRVEDGTIISLDKEITCFEWDHIMVSGLQKMPMDGTDTSSWLQNKKAKLLFVEDGKVVKEVKLWKYDIDLLQRLDIDKLSYLDREDCVFRVNCCPAPKDIADAENTTVSISLVDKRSI